ncbi:MAG: hypothetical protein MRY71_04690, partial [Algiphilus sp.]|nr:hypothetical protein [Algiphilus sp.]
AIHRAQTASPDARRRRHGKTLAYIWVRSVYRPQIGTLVAEKDVPTSRINVMNAFQTGQPTIAMGSAMIQLLAVFLAGSRAI